MQKRTHFSQNSLASELTLWWQNLEVSILLVLNPITADDIQQTANFYLQL